MSAITQDEEQFYAEESESYASTAWTEDLWTWLSSPVHLFLVMLGLIPVLLITSYVSGIGVNMPFEDEWQSSSEIAIRVANGSFQPSDLVAQWSNEHRTLFMALEVALLVPLNRWNIATALYLNIGVALGTLLVYLALARRDHPPILTYILIPFAAIVFSYRQNANWSMSFQIGWYMALFCFALALWVLRRSAPGWRPLIIAAVLATLMLFSTFHGVLGFPLLFVALVLLGYGGARQQTEDGRAEPLSAWATDFRARRYLIAWIAFAVIAYGLFFWNYNFSIMGANVDGQYAGFARNPINILYYMLAYAGNGFVIQDGTLAPLSAVLGIIALLLFAANAIYMWRREGTLSGVAVWAAMIGFGLGSGLLTGIGRGQVFPDPYPHQPLISRYTTPTTPLWIATVALMVTVLWMIYRSDGRSPKEVALAAFNVLFFIALIGLYVNANVHDSYAGARVSDSQYQCVLDFPDSRNTSCLDYLYLRETPFTDVMHRIDQLSINRLSAFADRNPIFVNIGYLYDADREPMGDQTRESGFRLYQYNDHYEAATFVQPAPGQMEFTINVPQTDHRVDFVSAMFVDRSNLSDTEHPQDGVLFRVGVRTADGNATALFESVYDPNVDNEYKAFSVNLDAYKGQTVRLILQTTTRENPNYDNSMWVDPVVIVRP